MIADLTVFDWIGVAGSLLIAGAYLSVTRGWVAPERVPFNLVNLAGAALILTSLWYRPNIGAILIELLWVAIAGAALVGIAIRRWRRRKPPRE